MGRLDNNQNFNPYVQALLRELNSIANESNLDDVEAILLSMLIELEAKADLDENQPVRLRFTKDGSIVEVTEDTVTPSNNIPLPVKLTGITGDISITAQDLDIQSSHTGTNPDSMQIGDGTEILLINADGSINISDVTPSSIGQVSNTSISNVTATQITATSIPSKYVTLTTPHTNTGRITIGSSSVTDGYGMAILNPGESWTINIDNVNKIYAIAENNNEDVTAAYIV